MITQNITLDFCRNDYKTVTVKQYDKDSRNLLITCTDNGSVYKLNSSTQKCNVKMNTPDNRAIYNTATITNDGKVLIVFDENMVYSSGTGQLEIQIIEQSTKHTLSSMILTVIIVGSVYSDDTIIASDEFNALTEALLDISDSTQKAEEVINQANETIERIEELESAVATAETARTTDETARKSSETARQENEAVRESNETKRIANEKTRQSNASTVLENAERAVELANTAVNNANEAAENAIEATNEAKAVLDDGIKAIKDKEGSAIVFNDSTEAGFEGLTLYGKSKQGSTTGAQLFDIADKSSAWNSTWISEDEDGWITVECDNTSGTGTMYLSTNVKPSNLIQPSQEYLLVVEIKDFTASRFEPCSNGTNSKSQFKTQVTLDSSSSANVTTVAKIIALDDFSDCLTMLRTITHFKPGVKGKVVFRLSVLADTSITADTFVYEKFTGNKPSPNPKYPQEVVSVGDGGNVEGKVCGKNLLNVTHQNGSNKEITLINDNGVLSINGTATGTVAFYIGRARLDATKKYILSGTVDGSQGGKYFLYVNDTFRDYGNGAEITGADIANCYFIVYSGVTIDATLKPMIRLASIEDDTYEPYKEEVITLQTPNGLPGIPVSDASLATYTDENGQMWCADEIDVERGVYVKRVGVKQITSDEVFTFIYGFHESACVVYGFLRDALDTDTDYETIANLYCTHATISTPAKLANGSTINAVGQGGTSIYINFDGLTTADEYKAFFTDNEVYVTYILATPIETPLSDEEILAYKALHSNKPTTVITNSENAYMKARVVTGGIGQDIVDIIETFSKKNNDEIEEIVNVKVSEEATARDEADNAILEKIDDIQEIIKTSDGSTIVINDSVEAAFQELHLYGKSKQGSTTGAQLFDASTAVSGFISTEDGKEANSSWWMRSDFISVIPLNDYCISQETNAYFQYIVIFCDENKTFINGITKGSGNVTKWTFQTPENAKYMRMVYSVNVNGTVVDRGNIMLNAGTEPLPWEPYTGGKPSPNPEYQQEVVSDGQRLASGVQLFDFSTDELIYCSFNNGVYTSSALSRYYVVKIPIKTPIVLDANTNYYLKAKIRLVSGTGSINTMNMDDNSADREIIKYPTLSSNYSEYIVKYNKSEPLMFSNYFNIQVSADASDLIIEVTDIILCKDVNAVWEPYTGGVKKAYDTGITTKLTGAQLFDGTMVFNASIGSSNGKTLSLSANCRTIALPCKPNTTYTITKSTATSRFTIGDYYKEPTLNISDINLLAVYEDNTTNTVATVTTSENAQYLLVYYTNTLDECDIMVNYGTTSLPYEPYTEQTLTHSTPNGLPGIPLGTTIPDVIKNSPIHMSGVYWDNEEGQYYIADTVDGVNGVRVQRILYDNVCAGNVSISGDSNWYDSEKSYSYEIKYYRNGGNTFLSSVMGLCTHFKSYDFENFYYKAIENGIMNNQPYTVVNISKELGICTTVDEFKTWCTENDVKIAKVLADPIETPLSDEEILAYKALHTNKPNTTIMNSDNAYMKTKYVAGCIGGNVARIVESYISSYLSKASITYGTEDLEAGVSTLAAGTFYFVYE